MLRLAPEKGASLVQGWGAASSKYFLRERVSGYSEGSIVACVLFHGMDRVLRFFGYSSDEFSLGGAPPFQPQLRPLAEDRHAVHLHTSGDAAARRK